jgi:SAM-dependent methyltransferase
VILLNGKKPIYKPSFFKRWEKTCFQSSEIIIPIVLKILGNISSVVDMGCGTGPWLSVFNSYGITDFTGIDGDYVNEDALVITKEHFKAYDLNKPLDLRRTFDLVVSLEVAEHLYPQNSETFVKTLIKHGSIILFSAAIPFQGGTHHFNEQYQDYWSEIFKKNGYFAIDCIRPKIWDNKSVYWWYRQNIILYIKKETIENNDTLKELYKETNSLLNRVHPQNYLTRICQTIKFSPVLEFVKFFISR